MARRRFFVEEIRRGMAELTGAEAEHLVRVLRAEAGDVYEICDNEHVYLAEIETARKSLVSFKCLEQLETPQPVVTLHLLPALFKFDRFEWMLEKATEQGVSLIQPFEATRTDRGLLEASRKRLARWERIGVEASQQSHRARKPRIEHAVQFEKAVTHKATVRLLLDEAPEAPPILAGLPAERSAQDEVAILLGPEGGWTESERERAIAAGWVPCSLGTTILRAETAAVAGLAVVAAAWGSAK